MIYIEQSAESKHHYTEDMEALRKVLNHPYIIKKELVEAVYGEDKKAFYVRLQSRATGKHRFTEEEYKKCAAAFRDLSKKLRTRAERLEVLQSGEAKRKRSPLDTIRHPALRLKNMALDVSEGGEKGYYQQYDRLRERATLGEEMPKWANTLRDFADFIDAQLEAAKHEAHTYRFSYGKGKASHLDVG